ncbi:MAG: hypothetical protein CMD20_04930 [Flavobacteriales bacterium]|nr:hypothetical protein [Flavobacteriales bacterium]
MKIIKTLFKYFAVLILVLILAVVISPILFKGEIVEKVEEVVNESVNAKVDFGEFDLSLISSFPNFLFEINDISIINKSPFEGDTLAHIGNINLELNIWSVIGGEYTASSFNISNVTANAKVLKDGTANWDIALEDSGSIEAEANTEEEEVSTDVDESENFIAGLKSFSMTNVNLSYVDLESEMVAIVKGLNQSGDMILVNDSTEINIQTGIESILLDVEGERLANQLRIESTIQIAADLAKMAFHFKENVIQLNDLKIGLHGDLAMPDDDMDFDLTIKARDNKFKDVLSITPASFLTDLEGVETKGEFNLVAHLKGKMDDENLPGFDVDFGINDGYVHYPDLPESIENINMDLAIDNKTGKLDHTTVDLKLFHLEIAKNPIDLKFFVTNVESDPKMKGEVHSKIDLEKIGQAIPIEEGEEYQGKINANFEFGGLLSSIENEKYEEFKSEGSIILDNLMYTSNDLPPTLIKTGYLNFSPNYFEVSNFDMKIGKSDLMANGRIDNILPYVFHDSTLVGEFKIHSNFFDLNELAAEDTSVTIEDEVSAAIHTVEETMDSAYEAPMEVIEIPKNIDFTLNSTFEKIDFEDMPIKDFSGQIKLNDGIAHFHNTTMKVYHGLIRIDGEYNTQNMSHPSASLDLTIDGMEIKEAYLAFNPVKKMIPIAEKAQGEFHTEFQFTTELDDTLAPVYKTMNGKGFLKTTNLGFIETDTWKNILNSLGMKNEKFGTLEAEDVKIDYEFIHGKLHTYPFDLNLGKIKGKVGGYSTFDGEIKYTYALKIPRKDLGVAVNNAAGLIQSIAGKNGIDISLGEYINIDVQATGTIKKPIYTAKIARASGSNSIKNTAKEMVDEQITKLKEKAEDELNKAKLKAQEEATKLKKETEAKAKLEAEKLKKETDEKIKLEAENAKSKAKEELKDKAKGLLKDKFGR